MTPVEFQFNYPDGEPIANTEFVIKLAKSGFVQELEGILMPTDTTFSTDDEGRAVVGLAPSDSPYTVRMTNPTQEVGDESCTRGINYRFYVPISDEPVRAQDLVLNPPPTNLPYDQAAIQVISDAKVASVAAAKEAATNAEEVSINTAEVKDSVVVVTASVAEAEKAKEDTAALLVATTHEREAAQVAVVDANVAATEAQNAGGIFKSTAEGLLSGKQFFSTLSPDASEDLLRWENVAGAAVFTGKTTPSTNALITSNIWFDPFGESLADRPTLGFGTRSSYAGTLNLNSANTPYTGKPTLSTTGAGNVQRIITLRALGKKPGDRLRFLAEFSVAATGGQMAVYFRDAASAVVGNFIYLASQGAGNKTVVSDLLTIPATTSFIELRCSGGNALELFAVAAGEGAAAPKVCFAPTPASYGSYVTSQKNLWPDPFLRQYQAGIRYQDGWGYAQLAGVAVPGSVTTSPNSPFPAKNVIQLPTGAGQHDFNIDASRLGLRLGMKITVALVIYAGQSINFSVFGRSITGTVLGDPSNVSHTWTAPSVQEIRKVIIVDQAMLDTMKFLQVRILNGQTVGAVPIEICARGVFVGDTAPFMFDDCVDADKTIIESGRRASFGESTLRETQKRLVGILFKSTITKQLKTAHIGDSYTHLPVRWMQPFATFMQSKYGDGGPGWVGFGNPDSGSGNINGQNWMGLSITKTGTWASAYATAPCPDICSVASSDTGSQYRINGLPSGLSLVQLYAAPGAASVEYSTDGGASWNELSLASASAVAVLDVTIPSTGFNLWIRPKTGACTLFGIDAQKPTGHRVHKLGATGSSAAQWATQTATAAWKASMVALDPNMVSVMLATNDQTGSTAPWVVGGYIETIIGNIKAALPLADILVVMPAENQRNNNVPMAAYTSVVRGICARLNVAFCDLQQDYGEKSSDYAATSKRNWYSPDLIHPNPATDGGLPIAARMVKMLNNGLPV